MIKKVVCAVSGGVDSAVAALLLKKNGYEVTGVFMRNWDVTNETGHCTVDSDCEDAKYVCSHIGIPFHEINFVTEYWNDVFSQLIQGYEDGLTPNPDVLCNKHIKFGRFFDYVTRRFGCDAVATGHYARNNAGQFLEHFHHIGGAKLLRSVDPTKDQTLFLSQISQSALCRTMFPIGGLMKSAVRSLASEAGLETIVKKKESTGICFIGSRHFQEFIGEYIEPKPGLFVDIETHAVVGEHKGVHCWTIGQRALIGGLNKAYFVVARDSVTRTIRVAQGTNHPALYSDSMIAGPVHWINQPLPVLQTLPSALFSGDTPRVGSNSNQQEQLHSQLFHNCQFRFQHTHSLLGCRVRFMDNRFLEIHLDCPIRALTRGQYAVLYLGQECLGSAMITKVGPTLYEQSVVNKCSLSRN